MDKTAASTLFAWLDREVWLVTARAGGRAGGLIATFVGQASIVPELPRVLVGLARRHHTWDLVEAGGAFALHLLGEQHLDLVWRFGLTSGRDADKLEGLAARVEATGSPVLEGVVGWLDCRVEERLHTGDRTVYLAEVVRAGVSDFGPPLTAKRLFELAPPSKATELQRQRQLDSAHDAEAILAWRQRRAESLG